ncbi:Serine acetyltransferase [Tumidithrix helvetica PCC 7403]|uniref:serine O-acetyltransferase n=1 Tax=Tumidithrix helvetica TaxID=3457545 RepID=UPI003C897A37
MLQPFSCLNTLDAHEIGKECNLPPYFSFLPAQSSWQLPKFPQVFPRAIEGLEIAIADFRIIFDRDPAARHWSEVLCCYPGLHALTIHRVAHWLHQFNLPLLPRLISHCARFFTGIEIHPGATIGKGVFIDHGMGVVIGETAIVGDYALLYQGVTLGGTGKETGKRHPTIGKHAIVGAGAKVLGNIHIGDYARVGAGSIVLRDVPAHCTVVGIPGRICRSKEPELPLEHGQLPDTEATVLQTLLARIERLEQQLLASKRLESGFPKDSNPKSEEIGNVTQHPS